MSSRQLGARRVRPQLKLRVSRILYRQARVAGNIALEDPFPSVTRPPHNRDEEMPMLVTFKTDAHADIIMFGDVALTLLQLMGQSGRIPGALLAVDIPQALERLKSAVASHPDMALDPAPRGNQAGDDIGHHVSLANRALPLIDLLTQAAARGKNVMWES